MYLMKRITNLVALMSAAEWDFLPMENNIFLTFTYSNHHLIQMPKSPTQVWNLEHQRRKLVASPRRLTFFEFLVFFAISCQHFHSDSQHKGQTNCRNKFSFSLRFFSIVSSDFASCFAERGQTIFRSVGLTLSPLTSFNIHSLLTSLISKAE